MPLSDWLNFATLHPWLVAPFSLALLLSSLIWFGRLPQSTTNVLIVAFILPSMQLGLLGILVFSANESLAESLVALLPS